MTSSKQKAFDVLRISDDGSIDCYRMTWPCAAHPEPLKITVSETTDPAWIASQLRILARQFESGSSEPIPPKTTKTAPATTAVPGKGI